MCARLCVCIYAKIIALRRSEGESLYQHVKDRAADVRGPASKIACELNHAGKSRVQLFNSKIFFS